MVRFGRIVIWICAALTVVGGGLLLDDQYSGFLGLIAFLGYLIGLVGLGIFVAGAIPSSASATVEIVAWFFLRAGVFVVVVVVGYIVSQLLYDAASNSDIAGLTTSQQENGALGLFSILVAVVMVLGTVPVGIGRRTAWCRRSWSRDEQSR